MPEQSPLGAHATRHPSKGGSLQVQIPDAAQAFQLRPPTARPSVFPLLRFQGKELSLCLRGPKKGLLRISGLESSREYFRFGKVFQTEVRDEIYSRCH